MIHIIEFRIFNIKISQKNQQEKISILRDANENMKKEYNFKISEVWMRLILKLIKRMTSYLISRTTIVSRIVI